VVKERQDEAALTLPQRAFTGCQALTKQRLDSLNLGAFSIIFAVVVKHILNERRVID
jgi:hypothetical protein